MVKELPKIKIGNKEYFVDGRLNELRNIEDFFDRISCSSYTKVEGTPVMVCSVPTNIKINKETGEML